jgi:uncharacterized membrane protein YphA (DoxX/SURF4 family)
MEDWADRHHPKWIDYLRVILGIVLITKGVAYVINKEAVMEMFETSEYWVIYYGISHYVIGGSIACGIAIAAGLFTRVAVAFELPALLGSVIFIDMHKNLFALNSELLYSLLILALLLFYLFYGSGEISVDAYLDKHKDKE